MSNLTGDFDGVLEISNGVLNRLTASMHQNTFVDKDRPTLPHVVHVRIGQADAMDEEHGSVEAQIGVPQLVLIDGATDRFRLSFGLRARYRADLGSKPLADVIHGTVEAEYRLQDIDPNCWGWRQLAGDYLWLRVLEDSVSFDGVAYDDVPGPASPSAADRNVRIVAQIRVALATRFAPDPQKFDKRFRRFRCLAANNAMADAAIAFPLGLNGEIPAGDIQSIGELFLDGRDFGIAVSRDYILGQVEPILSGIAGLERGFHIHGDAGMGGGLEIDYHVRVDAAAVDWLGGLPPPGDVGGSLRLHLTGSGWASYFYSSGVFNIGSVSIGDLAMSFSVDQYFLLGFDPGLERLTVASMGDPVVSVAYGGPYSGDVTTFARDRIVNQVKANVAAMLGTAQAQLDSVAAPQRKSAMVDQLRKIDALASARCDEAVFMPDGLILRGDVMLSPRQPPFAVFEKLADGSGYDAVESWIPGGRIDRLDWSWEWYANGVEAPPGPPGSAKMNDDVWLRTPHGYIGKFGATFADKPLPGLDGPGRVCLTVRGVQVDERTGALVPVSSASNCEIFSFVIHLPFESAPYAALCDPGDRVEGRAREIGVLRATGINLPPKPSNTLVMYLGEAWDNRAAAALAAGLDLCRRTGTGLAVVLLFREGLLGRPDPDVRARLRRLRSKLSAPVFACEDVSGAWARALAIGDTDPLQWRLITPTGAVCWAQAGSLDAKQLAHALDGGLQESHPPSWPPIGSHIKVPSRIPNPVSSVVNPNCPSAPLAQPGGATLVFVQRDRESSRSVLSQLVAAESETETALTVVVVEGADAAQAAEIQKKFAIPGLVVPDPHGAITTSAGVQISPTVVHLDESGRVQHIGAGLQRSGVLPTRSVPATRRPTLIRKQSPRGRPRLRHAQDTGSAE